MGSAADLVDGADTGGTARPACARLEGLEAAAQQIGQNLEDVLGEANTAGVRVVEVDRRIEALGLHQPPLGRLTGRRDAARRGRRVTEPGAEVADVAQEEDR